MSDNSKADYKDTVFLPTTAFPMKAGLAQQEPATLARWQEIGLYEKLRKARAGQEKFIFHDGPPYANGDIHIGHALNKTLKDIVVRSQNMLGKDAPFVPGWDCHGLPIEWKIEEQYRKKKLNKDEVPPREFRAECRQYADKWVNVQREQFKRLGVLAQWDKPYLTMDFAAETVIVSELLKYAEAGQVYRGAKPVMWSPVEKTALAEAEVEYEDIVSTQIDVTFKIDSAPLAPELVGAHAVIWTTTPWTIPVNQALAYGADVDYGLYAVAGGETGAAARQIIIATALVGAFEQRTALKLEEKATFKGSQLKGATARHPMADKLPDSEFFTRPRPLLDGSDFVTTEAGTGLVHMAPDHGEDDFDLCKANGIGPVFAVDADGVYRDDWDWLPRGDERAGTVINKKFVGKDGPICADLDDAGALLSASDDFSHSYPHSWRSKAKIIYRCTPQWFVPMDRPLTAPQAIAESADANGAATLRETALDEIRNKIRFVPERGKRRLEAMVESRPDWVLSRQRAWGVPIALYVDRKSGDYLRDPAVNQRIIAAFKTGGADAWFDADHQDILGKDYLLEDYEVITDILDVWFDSGCTHAFVLESGIWPDQQSPADLYLEGTDQHRGWFQTSLLESCGSRGRAPYKALLTHGFTMDGKGRKMSKSLGNTLDPKKVIDVQGADILRLWAASVDFTEDHRIGDEILKGVSDSYRKLRNSFRYMLGGLSGFSDDEKVAVADMPELERYILHRLAQLDMRLRQHVNDFAFGPYIRELTGFAQEELSAFFFDIRKDRLYCDINVATGSQSNERAAYRTVMDILFHALTRYIAPILVFSAEEIWQQRFPDAQDSIHLKTWPEVDHGWKDDTLAEKWSLIRAARTRVTEAIEPMRRDKLIRSSLEAEVGYPMADLPISAAEFAELTIVAKITDNMEITVTKTENEKCGRCWRLLPEVEEDGALCGRCETVLGQ